MAFFLFVKQFVDMLYPYRFLDYCMVILVVLLLIYQTALVRPDIRKHLNLTDGVVLMLCILLTVTFLKSGGGYQIYFKVLSAFLLYFVGRIYYDRIRECGGTLAFASYLIIYLNLAKRIWNFGAGLFQVQNAGGDFYYNDTDMAFAIILAMVFLVMFGKNSVFKLLTVFLICPYMVFCSDAGIQMVLMLAVYVIMALYISELVLRSRKLPGLMLAVMVVGLLGIVVLLYAPILGILKQETVAELFAGRFFNHQSMYDRYASWESILQNRCGVSLAERLFGTGMGEEFVLQSLYLKTYYTLGWTGLLLGLLTVVSILYYVVKVEDRKTFYLAVIMAVLLLGSGVTVNSMESTQMSWFPMLFSGMVISSVQAGEGKGGGDFE